MKSKRRTLKLAVSATALLTAATAASASLLWGWNPTPAKAPPTVPAPASAPTTISVNRLTPYRDGSFTGPAVYQYYGYVQAKVDIRKGKIAKIDILRFPTDYSTSIYINTHALPMLEAEVIQAQDTQISGISGATLTSDAFVASIQGALSKAVG